MKGKYRRKKQRHHDWDGYPPDPGPSIDVYQLPVSGIEVPRWFVWCPTHEFASERHNSANAARRTAQSHQTKWHTHAGGSDPGIVIDGAQINISYPPQEHPVERQAMQARSLLAGSRMINVVPKTTGTPNVVLTDYLREVIKQSHDELEERFRRALYGEPKQ